MRRPGLPPLPGAAACLLAVLVVGCGGGEQPPFQRQRQPGPSPAALYAQAVEAYRGGELARAREILIEIPAGSAESARGHNLLGMIHAAGDDLERATLEFKAALDRDPDLALAHNNLGAIYARQGRGTLAELAFAQAVQLDGEYPEPREGLALMLLRKGRLRDAELALERARGVRRAVAEETLATKHAESLQSLPAWPWRRVASMVAAEKRRRAEEEAAGADAGEPAPATQPEN